MTAEIAADREARAEAAVRPTAGPRAAWWTRPAFVLPLIVVAVAAFYLPAMRSWFLLDDFFLFRGASMLGFREYAAEAFDPRDFEPLHLYAYRPLYFIGSDLLYALFGDWAPGYHAVVILLHLANVLLTFVIARRLTRSDAIGLGAAAIFGLHPVYATTVAWFSGVNSVIATTGQLLCIIALLEFDERRQARWLASALAVFVVALLFHQEVFLVPLVTLAYLALRAEDWRARLRTRATYVPFALFGVVVLAYVALNSAVSANADSALSYFPNRGLPSVVLGTVAITIAPTGGAGFTVFHGFLAALVGALVAYAAVRSSRYRAEALFAAAWFMGAMALAFVTYDGFDESVMHILIARKLYPAGPAIGLGIAIVSAVAWRDIEHLAGNRVALAAGAFVVTAALGFAVARGLDVQEQMRHDARATQHFHDTLVATVPDVPEGGRLYIYGAPPVLVNYVCERESPTAPTGDFDRRTLCILYSMVGTIYGRDVPVTLLDWGVAKTPAFRATLRPEDRVFCYGC